MHYEHSFRGIRGCTFEEEALYFEFSGKTPTLSNRGHSTNSGIGITTHVDMHSSPQRQPTLQPRVNA